MKKIKEYKQVGPCREKKGNAAGTTKNVKAYMSVINGKHKNMRRSR
jgi:hypothetical protein